MSPDSKLVVAFGGMFFVLVGGLFGVALASFPGCKATSSARPDVVAPATDLPPAPNPHGGLGSRVISCASDAVKRDWSRVYAGVTHCLTAPLENPMGCLDAVPAVIDVVACIVRSVGKTAAAQADQQGENVDIVTMRKAERSRAWIESRGLLFTE